jgi:hypothetical protein
MRRRSALVFLRGWSVQLAQPLRLVLLSSRQEESLVCPTGAAIAFGALVAEVGGVAEATLIAPWHRDRDWSPFLRSGRCGGSASFSVAKAWGGGGGVDGQCLT